MGGGGVRPPQTAPAGVGISGLEDGSAEPVQEQAADDEKLASEDLAGTAIEDLPIEPASERIVDFQELMDAIRRASRPPALWQMDDGEGGSMAPFLPSLSLMVRQSKEAHSLIEKMLDDLKRQPRVAGLLPATPKRSHYQFLSDLIRTQTRSPALWQEEDGEGGSLVANTARGSLIIRQSGEVHEQIYNLLTRLRRSVVNQQAKAGAWNFQYFEKSDWQMTAVTQAELTTLKVRSEPETGHWRHATGDALETVAIHRIDESLRGRIGAIETNISGTQVKTIWPDLRLLEETTDSDAAKQALDIALPWLPHRSNQELARMFEITETAQDDATLTLKMQMANSNRNFVTAEYAKATGRLRSWTVNINGRRTYRLRFQYANNLQTVSVVFPERHSETWTAQANAFAFNEVDDTYVLHKPSRVVAMNSVARPKFTRMLKALNSGDASVAVRLADQILEAHPNHALTLFFKAQCHDYSSLAVARAEAISCLKAAAKNHTIVRWLDKTEFGFLTSFEAYELQSTLPTKARTNDDRQRLAELALQAHQPANALEQLDAIQDKKPTHKLINLRINALLELGELEKLTSIVEDLSRSDFDDTSLLEVASLLRARRRPSLTETILSAVLSRYEGKQVPDEILRHCAYRSSYPQRADRLFALLQALPKNRRTARRTATGELIDCFQDSSHAVKALQFAKQTPDHSLRVALIAKAEYLGASNATVAEMLLPSLQHGDISDRQLDWLSHQIYFNQSTVNKYVEHVEARIRHGNRVTSRMNSMLESAYLQIEKANLAPRARSQAIIERTRKSRRAPSGAGLGFF